MRIMITVSQKKTKIEIELIKQKMFCLTNLL